MNSNAVFVSIIGILLSFAAFAKGAHDLWAASLIYLTVFGLVIGFIWNFYIRKERISLPTLIPLTFFIVPFIISFTQSINPGESYLELMDWVIAALLFWLALHIFSSDKSLSIILRVMVPLFWIQVPFSLYQYQTHPLTPEKWGTLLNGNVLVCFLLAWIAPMLNEYLKTRSKFILSGLVAIGLVFAMAMSTWGWICVLLFLPFLWIKSITAQVKKHPQIIYGILILGLIFVSVVIWKKVTMVYTDYLVRLEGTHVLRNPTERMMWWKTAWEIFNANPIWGVGIGNFPSAYIAFRFPSVQHTLYAHSILFTLLAEVGGIGCGGILVALGLWFKHVIRHLKKLDFRWPYFISVMMVLLFSTINIGLEIFINLLTLGLMMGIVLAPFVKKRNQIKLVFPITTSMLVFAMVPYVISPFLASQNYIYANTLIQEKKFNEAEKIFRDAIDLDPLQFQSYRGLAYTLFLKGEFEASISSQLKAIERNKLSGVMWKELGIYYEKAGNKEKSDEAKIRSQKLLLGFTESASVSSSSG